MLNSQQTVWYFLRININHSIQSAENLQGNRYSLKYLLVGLRWTNLREVTKTLKDVNIIRLQLVRCQLKNERVVGILLPNDKVKIVINALGNVATNNK